MIEVEVTLENQFLQSSARGWTITEHIKNFSHMLVGGRTYGIVSELGDGAWSIACLLSGLVSLPASRGSVRLNGKPTTRRELRQLACTLKSEVVEESTSIFGQKSVRKQIARGLLKSRSKHSSQDVIRFFELTPERLDRSLRQYSGEGWRASMAIGFAYGKMIFVCPWLSPRFLDIIGTPKFQNYFDFVKQSGAMIIVPTNKIQWAKKLADEVIYLENPYVHALPPELAD